MIWLIASLSVSFASGERISDSDSERHSADRSVNFCEDPVAAICGTGDEVRKSRLKFINDFYVAAEKKYKHLPRSEPAVRADLREVTKPAFDYFQSKGVPAVKRSLVAAVRSSKMSPSKKRDFLSYIENANFVSYVDSLDGKDLGLQSRSVKAFGVCGTTGMSPLAQADDTEVTRESRKQRIILCDSIFLREGMKPDDSIGAVFMVAAHELSHIMSAYWEPAQYQKLRSCLEEHYAKDAATEYVQAGKEQKAIESKDEEEIFANSRRLVGFQMAEISADDWARKAIGQYFKGDGAKLSGPQKIEFLRASYGYFCGAGSKGLHPSGRFRVSFMGEEPGIRSALGCKPVKPSKACGSH